MRTKLRLMMVTVLAVSTGLTGCGPSTADLARAEARAEAAIMRAEAAEKALEKEQAALAAKERDFLTVFEASETLVELAKEMGASLDAAQTTRDRDWEMWGRMIGEANSLEELKADALNFVNEMLEEAKRSQ